MIHSLSIAYNVLRVLHALKFDPKSYILIVETVKSKVLRFSDDNQQTLSQIADTEENDKLSR